MKTTFRLLSSLTVCLLVLNSIALAGKDDKRLDIYWVDVEGGAATLIVTPAGESVLIDSGNPGFRDPQRIVKAAEVAGIKQIDHLITTHYHRDHYGGAATLSTLIPIGAVHDNGVFDGMPDDPGKEYFGFKAQQRLVINPGDEIAIAQADGGAASLSLKCIGTRKQYIDAPADASDNAAVCAESRPKDRDGSDNANSIVMLLSFGDFRFFDAGDLTWNEEKNLVCPKNLIGSIVDVYQVSHHGLDSSNNPVVLQTLKPTVAIMNNGVTKGCMPEVFATLSETESIQRIWQVHKNERPDGATNNTSEEFIANHDKDCEGHFIKLSVAPDAKSYAVSIPATGKSETYATRAK